MKRLPFVYLALVVTTACGRPSSNGNPPPVQATQQLQQPAAGGQATTTGLTVLLPEAAIRQESSGSPVVDLHDTHYSFSQRSEDATLTLAGAVANREESSTPAEPIPPTATIRGVPVYVSENDGIKTATWIERGTAYMLDVECTRENDVRCSSDEFILNQIRNLLQRPQQ